MQDSDLLIQFLRGSEPAFAELVRRHVDLVFAAALRQVGGDHHRAEDIAQQVFIDLARKARKLTGHPTLVGWLYASTRYTALNTLRREQRRAAREKQTEIMNTPTAGSEARWEHIRPMIDEALQELNEDDRQTVLLRFFGRQPFGAIAAQLGISENAAQKRVDRALDRLHVTLQRRGISSTTVALGLALGNACVAAPAPLAGTVTAAALAPAAGAAAGTAMLVGWLKVAATVAAVGTIGWAGVRWAEPSVVDSKPALAPMTRAEPTPVVAGSASVPIAAVPRDIAPVPRTSVATPALPAPVRQLYRVKPGDTLKRIANAVGVTSAALSAENPGLNPAHMRVGDQLRLPVGSVIPPPIPIPIDEIYVIRPGDTLFKIAQKRDLFPEELRTLNPGTDWQQLKVGQTIRAP